MMRLDLAAAGLSYADEDGLFADFHGHRHTFIGNVGKAGVPLATAQKLARHSDPKLTANTYTHLGVSDKAAAIELLPDCPDSSFDAGLGQQSLGATGTDDAPAERTYGGEKGQHLGQQLGGETWQDAADGGEKPSNTTDDVDKPQILTLARNEKSRRVSATAGERVAEGTRTLDFWIHKTPQHPAEKPVFPGVSCYSRHLIGFCKPFPGIAVFR